MLERQQHVGRLGTTGWLVLAAVLGLSGCASSNGMPLQTNSIRDDLNRGANEVAAVEHRFELKKVASLSETLPVCIAYRMPAKAPWLTPSFKEALASVGQSAKTWQKPATEARLYHARMVKDTAAVFPAEIAVGTTQAVRDYVPGLPVKYEPVPEGSFRSKAVCSGKDTIFVDRERITFYSRDFPSDLAWSGQIHVGDLIFIAITADGAKDRPLTAKSETAQPAPFLQQ